MVLRWNCNDDLAVTGKRPLHHSYWLELMDIKASVRSSLPEDWIFLAEGGAHVVFRYVGQKEVLVSVRQH